MRPVLVRRLKTLTFICIFTSFAGIIYQLIDEKHIDYNSVVFGLFLGLWFWVPGISHFWEKAISAVVVYQDNSVEDIAVYVGYLCHNHFPEYHYRAITGT